MAPRIAFIVFLIGVSLLLSSVLTPPCHAAEGIDLDQALERFYAHNYDIIVNRYEIDKAEADLVAAKLLPNPVLSFNDVGNAMTMRPGDNTQLTLRLDQLIELGGKRELRTAAARETLEAARLSHKDTVRTLLVGFYNIFYNLKLDRLNKEEAEEELRRYDRILEIADKRFQAGHLSLIDHTKLKLARIDLENTVTTAETQLKNDREQFALLIGSATPVDAVAQLRETPQQLREEELIAKGEQNRPDLLALQKQLQAASSNSALARAGRIPDLTVGVETDTYGRGFTPTIGAGVSVTLPIFNRNQSEIQRRNAERSQLESQLERLKLQVRLDVRQALNTLDAAAKVFDAYRRRRDDMNALLDRSEKAFTLGGITALDLLDTRKSYRDFLVKYNQSLVQFNLNRELINVYTGEVK